MWFTFAILSALFASVRRTNEKQLSHKLNHFTIGWSVQLLSLPVILIALIFFGKFFNPFSLGPKFWIPTIIVWIGFYPLNTYFYINALKHGKLSMIFPLQNLGPAFALLLGWILINQKPSFGAVLGIFFIVLGVYVLNLKGRYLHSPLKIFTKDKANLYTVFCLVLSSLAGVFDTVAMQASEPIYYCFVSTFGAVITIYVTSLIFKSKDVIKIKRNLLPLGVAGTLFGLSYIAYLIAVNNGPLGYVTAIRSAGAVIGAIIGVVYLKEHLSKLQIVAIAIIIFGSAVLAFSREI